MSMIQDVLNKFTLRIKHVGRKKSTLVKRHNQMRLDFKNQMKRSKNGKSANARRARQIAKGTLNKENGLVV